MWWLAASIHFHKSEGQTDAYPGSKIMAIQYKKKKLFIHITNTDILTKK